MARYVWLVLVVAWLGWWLWPRSLTNLHPQLGPVVVLGDSLSAGNGSETRRGYVTLLSERLGIELVNRGVPGDTSQQGLARLDRDVLALRPALVVVELGGNDFLQKLPLDQTFQNLDQIVERCQNRGAAVLLLGVRGGLFSDRGASGYRELARRRRTGYVPDLLGGVFGHPDLMSDPIHPNDRGYERVATRVEPELSWMLRKMGRIR